jgi:hypothetical protein
VILVATRTLWNADNDFRAGRCDVALAGYERVLNILAQDAAADAESRDQLQCRLQALYAIAATFERLTGRDAERRAALMSALEVLDRLRALHPNDAALSALASQISLAEAGSGIAPGLRGLTPPWEARLP